ncbi:MAG TPA: hypothetical protein VHW09_16315 [Bryobacteraceae bacterium]|nr:hypothetical protein [Bryobacteraceae bacterium]
MPAALTPPSATAPVEPAGSAPAPQTPAADAAVLAAITPDTAQGDEHTLGPLEFRGYSDIGFGRPIFSTLPSGGLAGSTQSFSLGDFDLFVNARMGNHFSVLGEMLITSDFSNQISAEMDRVMLTYAANKYFKISAGKYHTAIGYYSNEFYRARFFQTATGAPILFTDEDDGGILPVHGIGLTATGQVPSGPVGLHWVAEIANGTGSPNSAAEPIHNFVDENNGKAFNLALSARPERLQGLDIGGSYYHDLLHPAGLGAVVERIYSAHAAVVRPHLELIAEGVLLQHNFTWTGRDFNTVSAYAQASYKIRLVRPYFRYEYQNAPKSDAIFTTVGRTNGPSLGVRYDFSDFVAFKLQYGLLGTRLGPSASDVQAQLAFAF